MAATILIPTLMRARTGGLDRETVDAATVGAALSELMRRHPALRDQLMADDGRLRRFVNVYLGEEDVRHLEGLATALRDGDVLAIVPAVAGG